MVTEALSGPGGPGGPRDPGAAGGPVVPPRPQGPGRVAVLRLLGPNWYASVMGTAIVANAGVGLPLRFPGLRTFCLLFWALSVVMLTVLLTARALHWRHHGDQARAHLLDPAMAPFYGCLAMALLAVGGGTMLVGADWIGVRAAVAVDAVLFTAGTVIAPARPPCAPGAGACASR